MHQGGYVIIMTHPPSFFSNLPFFPLCFFNVISSPRHPLPLRAHTFIDILPPPTHSYPLLSTPISMFQNSCVSRLFDTVRCSFVRGKLPYFLPCAAHMKIRESSTLKFKTKKFSAKHHNNFSEALTFSSGRFQSISHAKRGVRCPKGIETRLNFHSARSGKTILRLCNFQLNFHLILSEAPIQPQKPILHYALCAPIQLIIISGSHPGSAR